MSLNFTFNETTSDAYGIVLRGSPTIGNVKPINQSYAIAGRSGIIYNDTGAYDNRTISVPCFLMNSSGAIDSFADVNAWLFNIQDYAKLSFSMLNEKFFMAKCVEVSDIEFRTENALLIPFTVRFSCKPQMWLESGDVEIDVDSGDLIENPTSFIAKPLIKIVSSSAASLSAGYTIEVGSVRIKVYVGASETVYIDCETMNCYTNSENRNSSLVLLDGVFPTLQGGETAVSYPSQIESVTVAPRWWCL